MSLKYALWLTIGFAHQAGANFVQLASLASLAPPNCISWAAVRDTGQELGWRVHLQGELVYFTPL